MSWEAITNWFATPDDSKNPKKDEAGTASQPSVEGEPPVTSVVETSEAEQATE